MHLDEAQSFLSPALVVAIALAAGIVAQSIAQHLRVPGIVILIAFGVLLGPGGLGLIRTEEFKEELHTLVGFAIAVILFEGGLNLDWRRLRREARTIRWLVTVGAVLTWIGGALAARVILGWSWEQSVLFGSLVIVTGPTVITPILRRIKVRRNLETILEAEGVLIDAVGALLAIVALEVVPGFADRAASEWASAFGGRLLAGVAIGLIGGATIAFLLRFRGVVPEGLENVFTLSLALTIFQVSNAVETESGVVAAIVAGLVVGNSRSHVKAELKEFKEQLTVMLIGMLFVLLAASVPIGEVLQLGWPGFAVVLALMFVVRPIVVQVCTYRSGLSWQERAFLSWLAPRGIVAAAVATVFYDRIGPEQGGPLRALVFLVIAATVIFQGGTAGLVAGWLGVRRPRGRGYVLLGAHHLGTTLARLLVDGGEEVILLDANPERCRRAQRAGFRVYHGNALEERILLQADLESRKAAIALLQNEGVNLLFARKAIAEYDVPRCYVGLQGGQVAVTPEMVREARALVLFGRETDIELWDVRVRRNLARVEVLRLAGPDVKDKLPIDVPKGLQNLLLPLVVLDRKVALVDERTRLRPGRIVAWLIFTEREQQARDWLSERGWSSIQDEAADAEPSASPQPA